ncbi:MAG: hypothetical protein JG781_2133 [Peptococcaceae bacterium]|nr:hypothetical protein [Peptococcaceae bacterium]
MKETKKPLKLNRFSRSQEPRLRPEKEGAKEPKEEKNQENQEPKKPEEKEKEKEKEKVNISPSLQDNLKFLKDVFKGCSDIVYREFKIGTARLPAAVVFVDGLVNKAAIENFVIRSLNLYARSVPRDLTKPEDIFTWAKDGAMNNAELKEIENMDDVMSGFLSGDTAVLFEGCTKALLIGTKGWATRGISVPDTESTIRGSKEGFTETIRINTSMVRRRLRSNKLKIEARKIGKQTQTDVSVLYIDGIVNPEIVKEVHKRLDKIKEVDSILESGCIEQYIEDNPWSPFPQMQYTERPDKVVAYLLEGRVVIMIDGTPQCLIVPALFVQFLQSPEDYYERILVGTAVRWIRYLGVFTALTLPALYIAITTYHPEMIPTPLAITIAGTREGVPFPALVEALIMEISLELLREASIRLPGAVGGTLGIVGALIVGQAAVEARLVAPVMVVVVALTAIGSFVVPSFAAAIPFRLVRFPLMIIAAVLGIYGVMLGWIAVLIHMISLKSFGFPYMAPLAPLRVSELKDALVRGPRWQMMTAPQFRKPQEAPPPTMLKQPYLQGENGEDQGQGGEEK